MNEETLTRAFGVYFSTSQENYKAVCPFHDERTASFYVHKDDLIANCFGCGISGYIDKLLARYRGIDETQARKLLQIEFKEKLFARTHGSYREAPKYFSKSWLAPFKAGVHTYVLNRGFRQSTIQRAGSLFDPALQRQVFPHFDRSGNLLGVAGRSCIEQDPKWYFYWDYSKGRALYRLPRDPSGDQGSMEVYRSRLIITEGIFDLLRLYQAGYTNVASTLGTKFTKWQVEEIKNTADEVIVVGDNDRAGVQYQEKLHAKLRRTVKTYFIDLGDKQDVADLDEDAARTLIDGASSKGERAVRSK